MKITIGAGNEYVDFCYPHVKSGAGLFQSTEGLGFEPDPNLHVRPIPRILCTFPGVPTDHLIYWLEERGADVSRYFGPSYFTYPHQVEEIIQVTEANLSQNRYLIAPIDPNYRFYLEHNKIEYAILHPDRSMKLLWKRWLGAQMGNRPQDLKDLFSQWDKTIQELENVSTTTLAQRYRVKIKQNSIYVEGVPEYLKPESDRVKMYLDSYHDNYSLSHDPVPGSIVDNREPIYQINGEVYGRVKEHRIKLHDIT